MSIVAAIFSIVVSLGLPVGIVIYIVVAKRQLLMPFVFGIGTFLITQIVLRSTLLNVLQGFSWFVAFQTFSPVLYYLLIGGLSAAVFEEGGRWLVMRFIMKRNGFTGWADGVSFGIGHGGFEAAALVGYPLVVLLVYTPDTVAGIGPQVRDVVESGAFPGPRIRTGVQALLTSVGGTAGRLIPDTGRVGYAAVVNTIDEMVTETRRHIKHGADWIKIHATGSIPTRRGELQVWTLDEMKAVCDTAHALGVPVTAHCRNASSTRDAARAGVDLILHASFVDDEGLQAVIDHGAAICPTFTFLANLADYGHRVGAGAGMQDVFRGEIKATAAMLRSAYDEGVPILCGSESGFALTPYGHWHARELEVFVNELGLSPVEAIKCATQSGALAMRMEGELGVVAEGYRADVLVVAGDPATDVTVLQDRSNLRAVISRGVPVDLAAPWPERRRIPGEKVANWAAELLTYDRAFDE